MIEAEIDTRRCDEALIYEITDEALEFACCYNAAAVSTLIYSSYCFTCVRSASVQSRNVLQNFLRV
jgi:hypothetical protein